MNLLSSEVFSFRRNAPNKALKPLAKSGIIVIVKNIVSQVLEAVCQWRRFKLCNFNFNLKFIVVTVLTSFIQVRIITLGTLYLKVYLLALFVLWSLKKLRYQRWQYSCQLELNWRSRNQTKYSTPIHPSLSTTGRSIHTRLTTHPSQIMDMGYTSSPGGIDDVYINRFWSRSVSPRHYISFFSANNMQLSGLRNNPAGHV